MYYCILLQMRQKKYEENDVHLRNYNKHLKKICSSLFVFMNILETKTIS
jgi:hypothetical protein